MAAIPQVDIAIPLFDTHYNFRFTEPDASTTLGTFGFQFPPESTDSPSGTNQSYAGAFFPRYNTAASPMTPTPANYALAASAKTAYAVSGGVPTHSVFGFDGIHFLQIVWDGPTGIVQAKITAWPGAIDYSLTGMVTLAVTNPQAGGGFGVGALSAVTFADGSPGFVAWGTDTGFSNIILPIPLNLATPIAWVTDPSPLLPFGPPTAPWPQSGINYQADFSSSPTVNIWQIVFDLTVPTAMVATWTMTASGDVSSDAANALFAGDWSVQSGNLFYTPQGLFGIDWLSGDNTGCWYCSYDCAAFGQVTFTMPDASLGPSSDPSVYWVYAYNNLATPPASVTQFQFYPNWDLSGDVWWIRVPLQSGGDYLLEALTGEVYTSIGSGAGPGVFVGTFVAISQAGKIGGGS